MSVSTNYDYDLLVLGAGPGGYVAAIRGAQLGKRVAVVEKDRVGGVCLNIGCIPTKAIIHKAEIFRDRAKLTAMGVGVDDAGFRYETVFEGSRKTAEMLSKGVSYLLKKNGVDVINGTGKIVGNHEIKVNNDDGERRVRAGAIIVATGSRPKIIPGLGFDGERILSSDDALMMRSLPRRALIVGGGAIGIEFAHIFNAFDVEVHVVEMMERILPAADGEVTAVLARSFMKRGIKIYTSSKISSHTVDGGVINAAIEGADGKRTDVSVDKIFVMTGRAPNSENIGIEELGITVTNGFINVGDHYQTSVPSIYAIGDVAASKQPSPMLAHAASAEGEAAAEHIAGHDSPVACIDPMSIPAVVYSDPQIASFGLTEEQASAQGVSFNKAAFPFRACGKAVAVDSFEGMVKIITNPSNEKILGAHIVGPDASELIHELLLARGAGGGVSSVASMIHAHPTLSESIMEAARAAEGRAIHV